MNLYMIFYFIIIFLVVKNAVTQEKLGEIVATPNRSLVELNKVGSSVLMINKEQIDRSASTTTSGILQEFGGFSVSSKGNKGSDPSYFNRGLSRKYIKVLFDGMDLSDITSTQEEPTYIDNLNLINVDNIEILNGSQGTLYGGNAIGGVISINSSLPDEYGYKEIIFVEAGSYGYLKNSNSFKYASDKLKLVFNLEGDLATGYNSFIDTGLSPTEKDGYYLYGSNFLSNFTITNALEANFNGKFYKQHNEYDDAYSYPGDSLVHYRDDKVYALLVDFIYSHKDISHKITFQPTYTTRINTIGGVYEYDGRKNKLEYILSGNFFGITSLSGLEYLKKSADMNGDLANKEIHSIFSELRFKLLDSTNIDASVRREYDSQYDSFDTGRIQFNNNFFNNIIFRGSLGTGYRTPTPYELYSSYGNTNLKPEKSITYDLGSEIYFKESSSKIYIGAFETKVEDIIKYVSSKYRQSTANLTTYGTEIRLQTSLNSFLTTNLNFTKTHGKESNGNSITLVPKDKIVFSLNWAPKRKFNINTYYLFQNKSKDTKYNELPVYRSLNLNASYSFQENSKAFLKFENLLNRENIVNRGGGTSENLGYRSPGLSVYFGLRFKN
ncbi:TonB-dependent receptor [Alphaproteobacteria bacterium]|nr:TonB-dependent receptor [Alphaproteobacteria bacterium]